jgi:hypothetical protein
VTAPQRPSAPTIPRCGICGKPRVLYGGVCSGCLTKDEEKYG